MCTLPQARYLLAPCGHVLLAAQDNNSHPQCSAGVQTGERGHQAGKRTERARNQGHSGQWGSQICEKYLLCGANWPGND